MTKFSGAQGRMEDWWRRMENYLLLDRTNVKVSVCLAVVSAEWLSATLE